MPQRQQRHRQRLWKQDPRCVYCGVMTTLPNGRLETQIPLAERRTLATLDHVRNRLDPLRERESGAVLACWQCNQERGRADEETYRPVLNTLSRALAAWWRARAGD